MVWNDILGAFLRSVAAALLLLLLARIVGRKAISQMTFFDFTMAITVGSVTGNLAMSNPNSVPAAITTLVVLALLTVLIDFLHLKSMKFSKLVTSEPVVMVENGKLNTRNMKRIRTRMEDLNALLRQKNIFNIADVEFAVMEVDGKLSVLPKSQKQPVTPSDLHIPTAYKGLTRDLVVDGRVLTENLKDAALDEKWLYDQLDKQDIHDIRDDFYAGLDTSGNLYVSRRTWGEEKHGKYGIE